MDQREELRRTISSCAEDFDEAVLSSPNSAIQAAAPADGCRGGGQTITDGLDGIYAGPSDLSLAAARTAATPTG